MAGRVSPAFPQGGIGAAPPLPLPLPVRLLLAGAVLVLPLAVPAEGQHGDCHYRAFGGVRDGEETTYEGTDEQRTLSSKRDSSERSGGITPSTHWTPLISFTGFALPS